MPRLARLARHLPALIGVVLLCGAVYVVQREFRHLRIDEVELALAAIPHRSLAIAGAATVLSYGILTFYDRLATIYANHKVSYRRVAFASFCAYALSHNLGFAAVSGAAVRYRLYSHWGLSPVEIGKVVAFCSLTFALGGLVLGGALLFIEPRAIPFFGPRLPIGVLWGAGALCWALVAAYATLSRVLGGLRLFGHDIQLPGWRMAILQVLLASTDVAVTAAIFDTLLPPAPGLTYLRFLGIYVASYTAGLAANLPGGIGVFDTAVLLGLSPYLPAPPVIGGILIFRLYYYIVPLFLAGGLFAGNELLLRGRAAVARRRAPSGIAALRAPPPPRWSEPDFAIAASTGAVALCGALLLSLGILEVPPDFSWLDPDFAGLVSDAGQYGPSLFGTGLLVLAIGLSQRVVLAWGMTIILLLAAAALTAARGESAWIPAILVLVAIFVAPFRGAYYRHARLHGGPLTASVLIPLVALAACIVTLAALQSHVRMFAKTSWWQVVLSPDVPNTLRASLLGLVLVALAAAWRLLRPARITWQAWDRDSRLRYASLGGLPPVEADGFLTGEVGRAGLPFLRRGRVLLGLGDPIGAESDRASAIWRLRDLARQEGREPAFWHTGTTFLPLYADLGLTALPLDRQGLPEAEQAPAPISGRHYLCCRAERDLRTLLPLLPTLRRTRMQEAAE